MFPLAHVTIITDWKRTACRLFQSFDG